ncbi:hypothetical protein [Morganella morganii]|uniref:hypothetical protein n=1 Tax=Morganella morganii TaxID=582 RepID=UPI001A1B2E10|nr:hypothetical protein [Morganella morganii]MCU6212017.1 hypothetical protein [Morganella morganii]MCU6223475.1 hypothetical protein [Morganella morganii]MCU6232375.1 hypothetical protein [Morganella morganii]HAT1514107.1 hypothetical protein [Morganella morganii]
MKSCFIFVLSFFFIAGCKPGNPSGQPQKIHQFDGVYECRISQSFNHFAIEQKNKHAFPSVMTKTTITVKDGIMTIHGMTSGDYVTHQMSLTEPPITDSGRVLYSEVELRYKNGKIQQDFTKKYGIASVSEGDPFDKGFMQQLSSCRLSPDGGITHQR